MKNENLKQFNIQDFYQASFFISKDFKLVRINKTNPQRALFVFEDREDRQNLLEDFLFGRAQVDPKRFVTAIKELKSLLYSDL